MSPRRYPLSRAVLSPAVLLGLLALATVSGCAGKQATSGQKPAPNSEPASAETSDEAERWQSFRRDAAESTGSGEADQSNKKDQNGSASMANRAETFANRVEKLQAKDKSTASPVKPTDGRDDADAAQNNSTPPGDEQVQWESPQSPDDAAQSQNGPPMRNADSATTNATTPSPPASGSNTAEKSETDPAPGPPLAPDVDDPEATDTASAAASSETESPPSLTNEPGSPASATSPATDPETASLSDASLDQLVAAMRQRLRSGAGRETQPLRSYLAHSALSVLDPDQALVEEDITGLDAEARQAALAYQEAFTRLGQAFENADKKEGDARIPLRAAAEKLTDQLRKHRPLRIQTTELCKRVDGYGVYTPFGDHRFVAGREQPVIVYAELDNFTAQQGDDGRFLVRLNQRMVLYNESDGLAVWRPKSSETKIVDRSRNRRRDFFVVQVIRLPDRLTVGKYTLKLTITDEIGQTFDEASIPIRIVTESEVAAGTNP